MEQSKYESLLERSVKVQEGLLDAIDQLKENSKSFNERFVLHCGETADMKQNIIDIRTDLLKYLKWSILALLIILGGQKIVEIFLTYAK